MFFALLVCIYSADTKDFNYKGSDDIFQVHGKYKFELWGAQGGGGYYNADKLSNGGQGAYVYGEANFDSV